MSEIRSSKRSKPIIIIGADPASKYLDHPGGQVTAIIGLTNYLKNSDISYRILDTSQSSFPSPSMSSRIKRGLGRTFDLLKNLLVNRPRGVLIFTGEGFSMVERGLQAFLCRIFWIPAIVCLRSGYIITDAENSRFLRNLYRVILRLPNRVVVQGSNWVRQLGDLGFKVSDYTVILNWLPKDHPITKQERQFSAGKPVRFLYVGWLTERKGINELISAYEMISSNGMVELTFAGGGDLLADVTEWSLRYKGAVDVMGWVNVTRLPEIYDHHDVLVLPSYAEGFPNVLIEAMAHAMPAIATPVGGIPDSLEDGVNGWLVPVQDSVRLAGAMTKYIEDRDLLEDHSKKALETVKQKHDMDCNCEQLIAQFGS